jgi:hypothetical protein
MDFTGCATSRALCGVRAQLCARTKTCAGVGQSAKSDALQAPQEVLAGPPQEEVDANELNPSEFDDGHKSGLNAVADQGVLLNAEKRQQSQGRVRAQLRRDANVEFDDKR